MICLQCNKSIDKPWVLFDGTMLCPKCKKPLTASKGFSLEAKETYELSKISYLKALIAKGKEYDKLMDNAIRFCTESAVAGYPAAVVQLGLLYEKGFMDDMLSAHERWSIAYNFYRAVLDSEDKNVSLEDKKQSAVLLLDMLRTADAQFALINKRFDYEDNKAEMLRRFPDLLTDVSEGAQAPTKNRMGHIITLLNGGDSERAPIFGYYRVNKDSVVMVANSENIKRKNYEVYFLPCDNAGKVKYNDRGSVDTAILDFKNGLQVSEVLKNYQEGYLFFFKVRPKGKYNTKKLKNSLMEAGFARIITLIEASRCHFLSFKDDDLKYFHSKDDLINVIIKYIQE